MKIHICRDSHPPVEWVAVSCLFFQSEDVIPPMLWLTLIQGNIFIGPHDLLHSHSQFIFFEWNVEDDKVSNIIHFLLVIFEHTTTCPAHSSVNFLLVFINATLLKYFGNCCEGSCFLLGPGWTQHAALKMSTVYLLNSPLINMRARNKRGRQTAFLAVLCSLSKWKCVCLVFQSHGIISHRESRGRLKVTTVKHGIDPNTWEHPTIHFPLSPFSWSL